MQLQTVDPAELIGLEVRSFKMGWLGAFCLGNIFLFSIQLSNSRSCHKSTSGFDFWRCLGISDVTLPLHAVTWVTDTVGLCVFFFLKGQG